jgi:hypothetical protein
VFQKVEDLGLDGQNGLPAAQLTPTRIEDVTAENKKHFSQKRGVRPIYGDGNPRPDEKKSSRSQGKIKTGSKRGRRHPDIVDAG